MSGKSPTPPLCECPGFEIFELKTAVITAQRPKFEWAAVEYAITAGIQTKSGPLWAFERQYSGFAKPTHRGESVLGRGSKPPLS